MFAATIGYWAHYDIPATRLLLKPLTYQIPNFSERKTMRTLRDYWNKKHLPLSLYLSLIKIMNTKVLKLCFLKYT